eukprot:3940789-Rhodomonas_salina.2
MSGTGIAYAAVLLRACYALSGSVRCYATSGPELAGAMRRPGTRYLPTHPYAMSGTDLAYAAPLSAYGYAMRCPVLT